MDYKIYLSVDIEDIIERIGDVDVMMDNDEYLMFCYLGTSIQDSYVHSYIKSLQYDPLDPRIFS